MNRQQRVWSRAAVGLAVAGLAVAGIQPASAGDEPRDRSVVTTSSGAVRGTVADDHRTFQGVPYAAPPVEELRWRSPRPAPRWSGTRDATTPGNTCPQPTDLPISVAKQDEDCLNLNVTTPTRTTGRAPVIVWIHGGSFNYSAGSAFGAAAMAAKGDAVVVTINYRLGAFGFLAHPALGDSANLGLQDQQAALRWVRRNAGRSAVTRAT